MDCNNVNIKSGSSGNAVTELQKYLKYLGYYTNVIDGKCGNATVNAIKQLQKQYNVKQDGVFGSITCKASGINGKDISNTDITLDNGTWQNMMKRYNNYVETNKKEPNICYINKENPYTYITNAKYKDIKARYDAWVKKNNKEPLFCYINPPTTTNNTTSSTTKTTTTTTNTTGIYNNSPHFTGTGCNKLGQCTAYYCAPHSIRQCNCKMGIEDFTEATIAGFAGTTTHGTGHDGIEDAIEKIAERKARKIRIEWKNFSSFGKDINARWKAIGELLTDKKKDIIFHDLYRLKWGHYEVIKQVDTKNKTVTVLNSLGNKCGSTAYCGYLEVRSFNAFASYLAGISQPSIGVITYD